MKILLLSLTGIDVLLVVVSLITKRKLQYQFKIAFFYGLFFISLVSTVYLLAIYPILAKTMYFTLCLIELFLLCSLFVLWDKKQLRNRISVLILFIFVWWVLGAVLYFIFG